MEELQRELIQKSEQNYDKTKLIICTIFGILVFGIEITGAVLASSLAIATDSLNCLTDISIFLMALICSSLSKDKGSKMSFGYSRIEILSYLMTVAIVWSLSIWIIYESINEFIRPEPVNSSIMLITSVIGSVYNIIALSLTAKPAPKLKNPYKALYLNMKTKHTHFLIDLIGSVIITSTSAAIYFNPELEILDPICALLIVFITLYSTVPAFYEIIGVLMEKTPVQIDLASLRYELKHIAGVEEMHDLHVWTIGLGTIYLSCHFVGKNRSEILSHSKDICRSFGISTSIIQVEDPETLHNINCENSLRL